ncbi:MAG: thioredoxin-like domain-containing protein [Phycisphaerae bacterium]
MPDKQKAAELEAGMAWLNTDRPLQLSGELRGQVVVLDFWTYCCMNCMHVLPDLAYLEDKYRNDPVAFVGVHSAKFPNEASRATIRAAVLRYEIRHPVVVDENMCLWRAYGVRSWPTLVVIDSTGHVVARLAGEGNRDAVDSAVREALRAGRDDGTLADTPLRVRREEGVRATSGLAFPGKVAADVASGRLFVSDSNHNRIVISELPDKAGGARVIGIVGSGETGARDGPAAQATFNHPQGLACAGDSLYVADTENHLIRVIDLASLQVRTIAGTGAISNDRAGGLMGTLQGLNSPWDLATEGSTLYVAMAGVHQIWRVDLPLGFARALAGTGRENIVDGAVEQAALAQPSGICVADGRIFIADSEVSAVRGIDLAEERVFTVVGEGLFSFGDVDGVYPLAKLQHPLGVESWRASLLVADTYNHKIKLIDPKTRRAATLYGTGRPGTATPDGQLAFFEPGGLAAVGDHLFVADTNNHRIIRVDLESHDWCEVAFEGLTPPHRHAGHSVDPIKVAPASISPGIDVELVLDIEIPRQAHLSREAPWSVRVESNGATLSTTTGRTEALPLRVRIPAEAVAGGGMWYVSASFAYCSGSGQHLCVPVELAWLVRVSPGGQTSQLRLCTVVPGT